MLLNNKAGHKFPSGYPARRAWVEIVVTDDAGQEVFHSGKLNPNGRIEGETLPFEPHYNVLNNPDQVQIYEFVPGDINGNFTNVLERGYVGLKDNRLVPQGFSLTDPAYDTTQIVGHAIDDPDFNRDISGISGNGADILHLQIPVNGYTGSWNVSAKVWYQSLPEKWMAPIFEYSSPEIDTFRNMFNQADKSPVLIAAAQLVQVPISPVSTNHLGDAVSIRIFPTLATAGKVQVISDDSVVQLRVWNNKGQLVWDRPTREVVLPRERGIYWIEVRTVKGKKVQKVVVP